ncbi:MAG TPA: hypothetical protein VFW00_10825 [Rhodocyclaceae bacterium]|nr:hypothetical protein [Rhodocyclaceae bacterium]
MQNFIVLLIALGASAASAADISGYYESLTKEGHVVRQLCIKPKPNGIFNVEIFTSYCPSKECFNARMDGVSFSSLVNNGVLHHESEMCNIRVHVTSGHATVHQNGEKCGDDFGLLMSDGYYKRVRKEVQENDCSPVG